MRRCADYLEAALKRCGCEVINAQYGNMYDRVKASNAWPADLHIALHTNGFNGKVAGTRVHCYPSEKSRRIGRLLQDRIAPLSPGTSERLVESAGLYELRAPTMPAVLPEFGFHDNPEEAQWLIDNMETIAEETCRAVCAFFDVPYVEAGQRNRYCFSVCRWALSVTGSARKATAGGYRRPAWAAPLLYRRET